MEKIVEFILRLLTGLVEWTSRRYTLRRIESIVDIYVQMKKLVYLKVDGELGPVEQFVVFEVAPDKQKGRQATTTPYTVSCLYSDYRPPVESFMRYRGISVDGDFMEHILKTVKEGVTKVKVKTLDTAGLLHLMLSTETIEYAELHLLCVYKDVFYVALISTTQKGEHFTAAQIRMEIELTKNNLIRILRKK